MKRVLLIAYYFPPDGGAGTQRSLKFAKYLPENGWRPVVLTRELPSERGKWDPEDESLLDELAAETAVVRVALGAIWGPRFTRTSDLLDSYTNAFYEKAAEIVAKGGIDAVLITMSPFGMAEVGLQLRRKFGVPVIYDLRDPWALDGWREYPTIAHWGLDYARMRRALGAADGVIANTREAARAIGEMVRSDLPLISIPNGFDAEDFADVEVEPSPERDTFLLVHAGTLHSHLLYKEPSPWSAVKRFLHYRPEPIAPDGRTEFYLFRAMRLLRERKHPLASRIRFVCVGIRTEANLRCARESGVAELVEYTGYLSHKDSIRWLRKADALFLPLHDLPAGRRSLIVPGKAYEYLASNRPIVAALPEGDAKELLIRHGHVGVAPPCDAEKLYECLINAFEHRFTSPSRPEQGGIVAFERRELTRQLAVFLNNVATSPSRSPKASLA